MRLPLKSLRRFPGAESRKVSIFAPRGKLRCAKIVLGAAKLPLRREVEGDTPSSFPTGDAASLARFARGVGDGLSRLRRSLNGWAGRLRLPVPLGGSAALLAPESPAASPSDGDGGASLRSLGGDAASLARRGCISGCKRI